MGKKIYGSLYGQAYDKYNLYAEVDAINRDETNGRTRCYVKLVLENKSYTGKYCYNLEKRPDVTLKINGQVLGAGNYNIDTRQTLSSLVADYTGWFYHDELGRLSLSVEFSFSQEYDTVSSDLDVITGGSVLGTVEMEQFPVATTPVLPDGVTVGKAFTVDLESLCQDASYTHDLSFIILDSEYEGTLLTGAKGRVSATVKKEAANGISGDRAGAVIICETYRADGTLVGSKGEEVTFYMPSDAAPTVSFYLEPYNDSSLPSSFASVYVQGKSRVRAVVTAESEYGATINSYELIVGGVKTTSQNSVLLSSVLLKAGTQTVTVRVVDSRGNTAQASASILVQEYFVPYLSDIEITRQNGGLFVKATRKYALISGNGCPLLCYVKRTTGESFGSGIVLLAPTAQASVFEGMVDGVSLDERYSYDVRLFLEDTVSGAQGAYLYEMSLLGQQVAISLPESHGESLGIGMPASEEEKGRVDSAWQTYHHGGSGRIPICGRWDLSENITLLKSALEMSKYNLFLVDLYKRGASYITMLCHSEWKNGVQYLRGVDLQPSNDKWMTLRLLVKIEEGDPATAVAEAFDALEGDSPGRFTDFSITIENIYALL